MNEEHLQASDKGRCRVACGHSCYRTIAGVGPNQLSPRKYKICGERTLSHDAQFLIVQPPLFTVCVALPKEVQLVGL